MGFDTENLISDGDVQIAKTGEVIGAAQLTGGELIAEAGGRAENTVVMGTGWLKVAVGGIAKCVQYGNNGTLSVSDGAIATDIIQPKGDAISFSTLATVNGRHPRGKFSVDKGCACGLLLENGSNLRVLEGHRVEKIIFDQKDSLLVNGTTSAVVVDEGGGLLVCPGGEASNCETNQGNVFMLTRKADNTLLVGGTMSNLDDEDSGTIVENRTIYRLGAGGLQLCSSGRAQDLSVSVGGRAETHAGILENAVIQDGTVTLLSPTSTNENFVVEEDCTPVKLAGSVALLDGASIIIGYGADLQQSTIIVQQDGVLVLDGSMVKGDSVTFSVGNINLNDGELWLITGAATQMHLKVKRLRGEGAICLQTSAKKISPDFINVKGEATGDIHVEITDASRQTLRNALKLQPGEGGIEVALQPA